MSRLVDRRPAVAARMVLLGAVLLAPRRLLGWVAAAGALLLRGVRGQDTAFQRGLVHPPG